MAYNSSHTGPEIDAAVGAVQEKEATWDGKQDKVTGIQGQVVGFDQDGDMVAEDKYPQGGEDGQILTKTSTGPAWQDAPSGLPDGGTPGQVLTQGESGPEWTDAPDPLPTGGETGQVLTKTAEGTAWDDVPSDLPSGGTDGQVLTKTSDGVAWEDVPDTGVTSFNSRTGAITPQAGDYTAEMVGAVSESDVGVANGVAELDSTGKVPTSQLPSMDYIPNSEKGANSGVATLDVSGKLNATQKPTYTANEVGARPNTWTPTASDVGAVPTSRTVNGKALSSNITLTADDVNAASPPTSTTVTLTTSGWSSNTQTVTVPGVSSDETAQLIQPMPAMASQTAYYEAGILCTGQAANQLTFTCQNEPTEDLTVYVVMQEVGA